MQFDENSFSSLPEPLGSVFPFTNQGKCIILGLTTILPDFMQKAPLKFSRYICIMSTVDNKTMVYLSCKFVETTQC